MITPHAPEIVNVNKEMWLPKKGNASDPNFTREVAELYGNPMSEPVEVLFVPESKLIHPKELPSLTLLPVDKSKSENPLQVQTVYFFAKWITIAAGLVGIIILLTLLTTKKQSQVK